MMIRAQNDNGVKATLTIGQPITVYSGATLLLDNVDNTAEMGAPSPDVFVNELTSGSPITVQSGGKLRLGVVDLTWLEGNSNTSPFVDANGGDVVIQAKATPTGRFTTAVFEDEDADTTSSTTRLNITTDKTLISASNGATVKMKGGTITSSSTTYPAVVLGDGANRFEMIGGTLTSTVGPALTVTSGNTLALSGGTITTSASDGHAVDLKAGAKVEVGGTTITVASNAADGENYIDNSGTIHLSNGSSVTTSGEGGTTTLDQGGTVDMSGTITPNTTPVTDVTLDQTTLSLTTGSTGTLKATVAPEDATNQTVTWSSSDEAVATVDEKGVVTAVSAGTATITATATNGTESTDDDQSASCTVNVTKRSSSSGSSGSPTTTTTTTTNSDGSQTTTTTNKVTGTTTSTTTGKDGATTTVETKKDGTVTTTNKTAQGVTTSSVADQDGVITAQTAVVPESQKDEAVTLPVDSSAPVAVQVQGGGSAKVSIPAEDATPGTVAILVKEDGTEEVIKTSVSVDGTVVFDVEGNATIRIADNSKDFDDVADTSWENDAVDFVSARSIFNGTSAKTFTPDGTMTRGMLAQVLHNLEDNPQATVEANFGDVHDQAWYADAVDWAASQGIVQGYGNGKFGPNDNITREQLAVMLYRYAGSPAVETDNLAFTDADQVSAYAQQAMVWATQSGVISGKPGGVLDPKGDATRAETAQMLMNYLTH
jgi:hypothetical protein